MAVVEAMVDGDLAQLVDIGIVEAFLLSHIEHLLAFGGVEKLALAVEQLQGVPLAGVVAGGDDDAAVGLTHAHGQLGGRRRGKADIEHVAAHAHKGATHHVTHHRTGNTPVTANDNLQLSSFAS